MGVFTVDPIARTTHRAPEAPTVYADDLSAVRGDGIFEAALVEGGVIRQRDMHLERFERSARLLELEGAGRDVWGPALEGAVREGAAEFDGAFLVKWILSRGREGVPGSRPHGWILTKPAPPRECEPLSLITLSRGIAAGIGAEAPWLLIGAKSLSYGVVMAAARFAQSRGAHDALWMTTDGFVLEAPRANLVLATGGQLLTPEPSLGLLHGTTQREIFQRASAAGVAGRYGNVRLEDLYQADAVWLTSSLRLAAPVGRINGADLPADPHLLAWMAELVRMP